MDTEKKHKQIEKLVTLLVEKRRLVYILTAVLIALSLWLASGLTLESDFAKLLPQHAPSVVEKNRAESKLKNISSMVVLLEGKNPAVIQDYALKLADIFKQLDDIDIIDVGPPMDYFTDRALWYLSIEDLEQLYSDLETRIDKEIMKHNPLFIDLDDDEEETKPQSFAFTNEDINARVKKLTGREIKRYNTNADGTAFVILLRPFLPSTDMKYNKKVITKVKKTLADNPPPSTENIKISLGGSYSSALAENAAIVHDVFSSTAITLSMLFLLVAFAYRRFRASFIIMFTLIIAVVLSLGFAKASVGRLNSVSGFIFAILLGLGIDYSIHFLSRYDEERAKGHNFIEACTLMIGETGEAGLFCMLTTLAAFLSLTLADFQGFSEFGIIAGGGMILCYFVIAILMSPLIKTSEGYGKATRPPPPPSDKPGFVLLHPKLIVALFAVISIACVTLLPKVEWEYDFRNLERRDPESNRVRDVYMGILGLSLTPSVFISETLEQSKTVLESCKNVQRINDTETTIDKCIGITTFLPEQVETKRSLIQRLKELFPEDRLKRLSKSSKEQAEKLLKMIDTEPPTVETLPKRIVENFTGKEKDKSWLTLVYPAVELRDGKKAIEFSQEVNQISKTESDIGPSGQAMIMADVLTTMQKDTELTVSITAFAVFLLLLIAFRNLVTASLVFLPIVMTMIILGGVMALAGIKVGYYNMIVIPSLVGIGIDNSIHLVHRFKKEGIENLATVVSGTGRAIMLALTTTMIGYFGVFTASHRGLFSIGLLAILGLCVCLVVMLVFFPALLAILKKVR